MGYNLFILHLHGDRVGTKYEYSALMENKENIRSVSVSNGAMDISCHFLSHPLQSPTLHPKQSVYRRCRYNFSDTFAQQQRKNI